MHLKIATPFHGDIKAFYYNQKIIGFNIKGSIYLGNWGRGVWTYHNTWYCGAGAGKVGDKEIGFNIEWCLLMGKCIKLIK